MWKVFMSKTTSSFWKSSLDGLASSHVSRLTLSGMPKYSCTVRSIGGLRHLPPRMKNHGLNEEKTLLEKNNLSIESSEVNVGLVWIITTKCKSLKRVETCQKRAIHFLTVCYVNSFFRFNLSNCFYSLDIYTYPFNLFRIEPLIVHSYLNDVIVI